MGTNYYLRRAKPREVYDEYHIAKQSAGWRIHFQDSEEYRFDETNPPSYHSVADIRNLLASGEYQLADEYGTTWAPGEESLAEFEELCEWNGGPGYDVPAMPYHGVRSAPPGVPYDWPDGYRDPEGYAFDSREFR